MQTEITHRETLTTNKGSFRGFPQHVQANAGIEYLLFDRPRLVHSKSFPVNIPTFDATESELVTASLNKLQMFLLGPPSLLCFLLLVLVRGGTAPSVARTAVILSTMRLNLSSNHC
jgi:hypothetical protein